MNWVCKKKQMVIVRKQQLVCLSLMLLLLLLILSQSKSLILADDNGQKGRRFNKFKSRSSSSAPANTAKLLRSHEKGGSKNFAERYGKGNGHVIGGDQEGDGDEIFGAEKRRVHTGPNPLHNR